MNEEKVKIVLEIRNFIYGTEMKAVSYTHLRAHET